MGDVVLAHARRDCNRDLAFRPVQRLNGDAEDPSAITPGLIEITTCSWRLVGRAPRGNAVVEPSKAPVAAKPSNAVVITVWASSCHEQNALRTISSRSSSPYSRHCNFDAAVLGATFVGIVIGDRVGLARTTDLKLVAIGPEAYQVIANRLRALQR